jgi:hypothetical protein
VKKAISAVLTLLLISGCVAPPRQLSKSDVVAEVAKSSQECPDCTCPDAQECPVLIQKGNNRMMEAVICVCVVCALGGICVISICRWAHWKKIALDLDAVIKEHNAKCNPKK